MNFGMHTRINEHDHRLTISTNKVQRVALFMFNRKRAEKRKARGQQSV